MYDDAFGQLRQFHAIRTTGRPAPAAVQPSSASTIFATIQHALATNQPPSVILSLVSQFDRARTAENSYGGLSGDQLTAAKRSTTRFVLWVGYTGGVAPGVPSARPSPLRPIGTYAEMPNEHGSIETIARAVASMSGQRGDVTQLFGIGFENVPEPFIIYPRPYPL